LSFRRALINSSQVGLPDSFGLQTGFRENTGVALERDFWPGIASELLLIRPESVASVNDNRQIQGKRDISNEVRKGTFLKRFDT
jgi:hypothetical protein